MHTLASRVDRVCVYTGIAEVERVAHVPADARRVVVEGLPAGLDPASLRVEVGVGRVGGVHLTLESRAPSNPSSEAVAKVTSLEREARRLQRFIQSLEAEVAALRAIAPPPRAVTPPGYIPRPSPARTRVDLLDLRGSRIASARADLQALAERSRTTSQQLEDARRDLAAKHEAPVGYRVTADVDAAEATELRICYRVEGPRWFASYRVEIDSRSKRAALELHARIGQRSGEDWADAEVTVSSGTPRSYVALPVLASQRVGRAQRPPKKSGYRRPLDRRSELFDDYLDAQDGHTPPPIAARQTAPASAPASAPATFGARPPAPRAIAPAMMAMPAASLARSAPGAAPPPPVARKSARAVTSEDDSFDDATNPGIGGAAEGAAAAPVQASDVEPAELDLTAFGLAPLSSHLRGRLVRLPRPRASAVHITVPSSAVPPEGGAFAESATCAARTTIPSDGRLHGVLVKTTHAAAKIEHVTVPREDPRAYRTAAIQATDDADLFGGTIEVFVDGAYLLSSTVAHTAAGGWARIGLGVDPRVRVARNVRFHEEKEGLMGGWSVLHHDLEIELRNGGSAAIDIEVRERVPVPPKGAKDLEVRFGKSNVGWHDLEQSGLRLDGGRRTTVTVPPGGLATVAYDYSVRLPSGQELQDGNRRD